MNPSRRILFALVSVASALLPAQELLVSLQADVSGAPPPFRKEEILRFIPGQGLVPFLPREGLNVLVGDRNGNGILDDASINTDAFQAGSGGVAQFLFSVSSNMTLASGTTLRDGDVFRFDGVGGVVIAYTEDWFISITGTTTIDIDAIAVSPSGDVFFSFADDETTTSAGLISQNGGVAILDEQTVFLVQPGQAVASIRFSQAQVAGLFNQALGTSVTSVVDVVAIALDPWHAGEFLLTSASTSQSLKGRIVSSFGGGSVPSFGGVAFDPAQLGLGAAATLDGLSFTSAPHPVLRAAPDQGSSAAGGAASITIEGVPAGLPIQLLVSEPVMPGPFAWQSPGATGFGAVFPSPNDPMFHAALSVAAWRLVADAGGRAHFDFDYLGLPAGKRAVIQAVVIPSLALSTPVSVAILP